MSHLLLLDLGNTHTHLGLANNTRVLRQINIPTAAWQNRTAAAQLTRFVGRRRIIGASLCSVVPKVTPLAQAVVARQWGCSPLILDSRTVRGVGIDYPKPGSIVPDRLA